MILQQDTEFIEAILRNSGIDPESIVTLADGTERIAFEHLEEYIQAAFDALKDDDE